MAPPAEITELLTMENDFSCTTVDNKLYTISVHKKEYGIVARTVNSFSLRP
jgi:hypothetical protein